MLFRKNFDLVLVDGSSQFYRAFHQLRTLMNSLGIPTGAVFGFSNIIRKILREFSPRYIAIAWDSHEKVRKEKFAEYKAKRHQMPDDLKVQIPYLRRLIDAYGIPNFELEGLEADDVIASLLYKMKSLKPDIRTVIVTSDKDLMQLVDENTFCYDPRADEKSNPFYGVKEVKEKFFVEPYQIPDYLALVGDTSDNIPGAKGVGPEIAKNLLSRFRTVEEIFDSLEKIEPKYRRILIGQKESVLMYKSLTKLKVFDMDINPENLELKKIDYDTIIEIFRELEFSSYLKEIFEEKPEKFSKIDKTKFYFVDSQERFEELKSKIEKYKLFAIDTETTSTNPVAAELVGVSIAFEDGSAYYFDLRNSKDYLLGLKDYFLNPEYKKVGQNIKYDIVVLKNFGLELLGVSDDSMILAWIINPDRTKLNLGELTLIYLGHKSTEYDEITAGGKIPFQNVPREKAKDYSCEDALTSLKLVQNLKPIANQKGLILPYEKIEMEIVPVLADMELSGVKVSKEVLHSFGETLKKIINEISQEIYSTAGVRFNIDSPQQLSAVLFEKLKIQLEEVKRTKKTKSYSTDNEVLQDIADRGYKIGELLLKYRTLKKLLSTYIMPIPAIINPRTGRVHPSFNQTKTATGRISCSDPNLQNIPAKGEEGSKIREAFCSDEGNILVSADYSQIELRVMAHFSGDTLLKKAFEEDLDIHTEVASAILKVPREKVGKDERRLAKTVNFGIIYGISAHGLKTQAKLDSRETAQKIIDLYFERFQAVREWRNKTIAEAERNGFVRTISGRIRYVPELRSEDKNIRGEGERKAVNTPIQGTSADIMKVAMINIWNRLKREEPKAKIVMQIHDQIIVECPEDKADSVSKILQEEMRVESFFGFSVPLKVKVSIGRNWAEFE
ncbi:MAG: DNA polymerase I [Candidatus Calescibacterium sp.]|nr:DNA polymerase I [Candidatus Calescibacterium sp.]MCX7733928.1 DNA polymerase I [bacterium]MDW8086474.1 DNA polymerase I [Candidatus Calescibacterium sp.]